MEKVPGNLCREYRSHFDLPEHLDPKQLSVLGQAHSSSVSESLQLPAVRSSTTSPATIGIKDIIPIQELLSDQLSFLSEHFASSIEYE